MRKLFILSLLGFLPTSLSALPSYNSYTVTEGGADVRLEGSITLNISAKATTTQISWDSFSIGAGELVEFQQASVIAGQDYYVVNTVTGSSASTIAGQLSTSDSKGHIYLVNTSGINITSDGVVNVGSFLASTLDMVTSFTPTSDLEFSGSSTETLTNAGMIYTSGGDAVLIGYRVVNSGTVSASSAAVIGAGVDLLYQPSDDDRIAIQTSGSSGTGTGISNTSTGTISGQSVINVADGNIYSLSINQAGTINCTVCLASEGKIRLVADGMSTGNGSVNISGTIGRSTTGGEGPNVEVYGANLTLDAGGTINVSGDNGGGNITFGSATLFPTSAVTINATGTMRTDALTSGNAGSITSYASTTSDVLGNIYASGAGTGNGGAVGFTSPGRLLVNVADVNLSPGTTGNYGTFTATSSDIRAAATSSTLSVVTLASLQAMLAVGNVHLVADGTSGTGNINFSDNDVTWSAPTQLAATASGVIQVDKDITQTGSGYSGTSVLSLTGDQIYIGTSAQTHDESAGFSLTSGDFSVDTTGTLGIYGGDTTNASGTLKTESGTGSVSFGNEIDILAGDGSGTNANLGATTLTVNSKTAGIGDIEIRANDCSHARMTGTTVNIGTTIRPNDITIVGGCCGNDNDGTIGSTTGASAITINTLGDLMITGGSGGSNNHAQVYSASGTSNITIDVAAITIDGGTGGSNNHARIRSDGSSGTVSITTTGDVDLTGAGTGSILSSAMIRGPTVSLDIGRDLSITGGDAQSNLASIHGETGISGYVRRHMTICGGGYTGSIGALRAVSGNIVLDNPNSSGIWTIQGASTGSANESGKIITDTGHIHLGQTFAPHTITLQSGAEGVAPIARIATLTSGDVRIKAANDVNVYGGGSATTNATASIESASGHIDLNAGRDVNMVAGTSNVANSHVLTSNGTTTLTAGRDMTMVGSCTLPNNATLQGTSSVSANVTRNLLQNGNTSIQSSGTRSVSVGGTHTVIGCSGSNVVPTVFPGSNWYQYAFLYELLYKLRYYEWYDWYLFHSEEFFDRVMVPSP